MAYTVVQSDGQGQREILMSLWDRNFGSMPENRYQWLYENNPSGQPVCFYLREKGGDSTVGSVSMFPRTMYAGGQRISGFICGDLTVDKEHRALGPAVRLMKAAMEKCESLAPSILFGIPNRNSGPVMRRAGFKVLDKVCELTQVLSLYPYIAKRTGIPALARAASFTLNPFLRLRPFNLIKRKQKGAIFDLEEAGKEKLLGLPEQYNEYSLIGDRNRKFLKWRFSTSPYARYRFFTLQNGKRENSDCYIAFSLNGKRAGIADFFAPDLPAFQQLFASFAEYQRSMGAEAISCNFTGDSSYAGCLQDLGFSLRSREQEMFIYTSDRNGWAERLKSGPWYLTSADNDV